MTKTEAKRRLRAALCTAAAQLPTPYSAQADRAILKHLMALPEYRSAESVFCFVSTAQEIDTHPLLADALSQGKLLSVPRCPAPGVMELRQITTLSALSPGRHGILEPSEAAPAVDPDQVDFAVIPCVCCDREGHRLGHGGGYYDRFLSTYRAAAVLVCRERLLREEIPVEPHDCIVHWVVTERGLYEDGIPARLE